MNGKINLILNIGSTSVEDLVDMINEEIKSGWQPFENVFMDGNLFTILMASYQREKGFFTQELDPIMNIDKLMK